MVTMRLVPPMVVGLSSMFAVTALAQQTCDGGASCQLTVSATATINTVALLKISESTTPLTVPSTAAFGVAAGVNSNGPTLTVKSNAGYTLTASPGAGNWTGGNNNKPS